MQPEVSKQEMVPENGTPPREEILQSLARAYGQEAPVQGKDQAPASSELASTDLSKVGSVGLEAGLTNFETKSADDSSSDDDSDDDNRPDEDSIPVVKPLAMGAMNPVVPAVAEQPMAAEDRDEIEMQWVTKAKKIVEQTKSDPHLQERAVSRLQADYLKKRFNKDIKLPKEVSDGS